MFTFDCSAMGEGYLESTAFYDLANSAITVELPAGVPSGAEFVFGVENPAINDYAFVVVTEGYVELVHDDGAGNYDLLDEGPIAEPPRFLRLGNGSGTLSLEVSEDGASWTEVASSPTPFDLSLVRLGNVAWSDLEASSVLVIDNYNVLP